MVGVQSIHSIPLASPSLVDSLGTRLEGDKSKAIQEVATDFESIFLSTLLKEMRQTSGEDGLFAGDTADVQGSLFDMFLGQYLAQTGQFGLGSYLNQQMQPPQPTDNNATKAANSRGTVNSTTRT